MADFLLRVGILATVAVVAGILVWVGRGYVAARRERALAASGPLPPELIPTSGPQGGGKVRILAFTSEDCRQCHTMQAPALRRVREARPDVVAFVEIDALSHPDLSARYGVLTLPATVVLDAAGQARAVNYGFANTEKLLGQVDEVVGVASVA
jgi:hypothetical protein